MKFKAAVLFKQKKPLKIIDINFDDKLSNGQILVKIIYSGICGSQVGEISGVKGKDRFLPHLLGHEGTGIVVDKNKKVKNFKIGDKVILHWKRGNGKNSNPPKYFHDRKVINAGWVTTFNEYAVVSENRLTKLPKNISTREGVIFGCAITTSYGVTFKEAKLNNKDNLLIIGAGNLGLSMTMFAKIARCKKIIVVDINKKKLILAKKLGATNTILYKNNNSFINEVKHHFKNNMPNKIIENTGNKNMIENAYELLNKNGKLILVGVPNFKEKISINTLPLHLGKKMIGSFGGGINPSRDIKKIINLLKNKSIIKHLLGKTYKLSQINLAISQMKKGKEILKPLIKF
ncbi:zinc-binding dehydrogenase [Candidatus Pelagibacter sp.]|nr:zinc-binding dehydrogenase [Candidatus Pelagibacter sp.]